VHPTDPKKIFVRTDGWKDRSNIETADDSLLYSSDGGKTWKEILHPGGPDDSSPGAKLFGIALSPDGSTLLAGYGDPVDSSRYVEASWFGVYKSSTDSQYSFGADTANPNPPILPNEPISCITWTKTGIYVCFEPQGENSSLGFATAPTFTSRASMMTLMRSSDTKGVPAGCSGRAATTCDWKIDCLALGACADGGVSTTTGGGTDVTTGTGPGTGPGSVTSTTGMGSGATGATTAGTGGAGTGGAAGSGGTDKPKGCNCRTPGRASGGESLRAIGWLAALALVARRRRTGRNASN
jgi:hypothetical protein